MSEENDGLDAPLEQGFQHGMMVAGQLGNELSQMWQKHRERQAKAESAQAALMQAQFNAERSTALDALKATSTPQWWDSATREQVAKAFEISTAWKDHSPEAALANQYIRQEAASRYGVDVELLARDIRATEATAPVLSDEEQLTSDLQEAKAHFAEADPKRLSAYEEKVRWTDSAKDDIPHNESLVADWRTATGQVVPEVQKSVDTNEHRAKQEQAEAVIERAEAATANREEREEHTAARNTAEEANGPISGDEGLFVSQLVGSLEPRQLTEAQVHEQVANTAGNTAGAKWDSAERREALANDLRTKAVPDEAITARMHAERQHARPISASVKAQAQAAKKTKTSTAQNHGRNLKKSL